MGLPTPFGWPGMVHPVIDKDPGAPQDSARDGLTGNPYGGGANLIGLLMQAFGGGGVPVAPTAYGSTGQPVPQGTPQGGGMGWQEMLRMLPQAQGGAPPGGGYPGATPGAPGPSGQGINTNVSGADFGRFIPGYGAQGPPDLASLFTMAGQNPLAGLQGGGGGARPGGGGGGGQGYQGAAGGANALLSSLFGGPAPSFDPSLMSGIQGLQGNSAAMYQQFPGLIGGAQDPIMAMIQSALGGMRGQAGGGPIVVGGGGGGFGGGLSAPDISLRGISPEAQALIDQMTASRKGELGLARQEATGQSLADLFGRGTPRSTMALDQQGRLQYGHEQALQQAGAAGADQTLQAMLADQAARTQLGQAQLSAEAQMRSAMANAGASSAASAAAAQAENFRSQLGLLGSIFGDRSSALASAFGSTQGANQGFAGILGDIGMGQMAAGSDRANTAASVLDSQNRLQGTLGSARIGANAQLGAARIGQQTELANLPFQNFLAAMGFQQSEAARMQDGIFRLLGLDQDRYSTDTAAASQRYAADRGQGREPEWWERILGLAGPIAGMFSFGGG